MYVLYDSSTATAVSDDGSVVVGRAHVPGNDVLVIFRMDNGVFNELAGPAAALTLSSSPADVRVLRHAILVDLDEQGRFVSDHLPVLTDVLLPQTSH